MEDQNATLWNAVKEQAASTGIPAWKLMEMMQDPYIDEEEGTIYNSASDSYSLDNHQNSEGVYC